MAIILHLRGRPALSAFRLPPPATLFRICFGRAFGGVLALRRDVARPLIADERAALERLLTYGPRRAPSRASQARCCSSCRASARSRPGRRRRPTSRATAGSTRSRASSAASRTASHADGAGCPATIARAAAADSRPHDRDRARRRSTTRRGCSSTFAPRPLATDRRCSPTAARRSSAANAALGLALSADEIDYLADELHARSAAIRPMSS